MRKTLAYVVVLLGGCPSIDVDPGEDQPPAIDGPTVEFDPANNVIPFPNNLVRTGPGGTVALPPQCAESPAAKVVREQVLNKLDGFGTYESGLQVTFTEAVDMASLAGKLVIYKIADGTTPVDPSSAQPLPDAAILQIPGQTVRFNKDCTAMETVNALTLVPLAPLDQHSTYVVALLDGVKTAGGASFLPSFTWALIRQPTDPVTLNEAGDVISDRTPLDPSIPAQLMQLQGIDLLWNAHAKPLQFLTAAGHKGDSTLIAWSFTTQTTTDPLDPTVAGTPAAVIDRSAALVGTKSVLPPGVTAEQFLQGATGACQVAGGPLPCQDVGDIVGAGLFATSYQIDTPNPLPNECADGATKPLGCPIPGPWSDPRAPLKTKNQLLEVFATIPVGQPPVNGWPVVIFGHGLTRAKTDMVAIASQFAAKSVAMISIDFVAHGSRAIRTSTSAAIGCADDAASTRPDKGPDPTKAPQCYAAFLSSDLAGTRDNIRQTVLDLQALESAVVQCGTTRCAQLKFDKQHITYIGQSLGGIIGSTAVAAIGADIKAAVLNVPGVGLVDILERTPSVAIKCSLVNSLIDAGILTGTKFPSPTATCLNDDWQMQPGYKQFRVIARWVLDPADGANFTRKLAARRILIQEVVNDQVVPNFATDSEGALVGLTPGTADPFAPPSGNVNASKTITDSINANHWVRYPTLPPAAPFPGNTFAHGSLLAPANAGADGALGTGRLQTDAITFLFINQ